MLGDEAIDTLRSHAETPGVDPAHRRLAEQAIANVQALQARLGRTPTGPELEVVRTAIDTHDGRLGGLLRRLANVTTRVAVVGPDGSGHYSERRSPQGDTRTYRVEATIRPQDIEDSSDGTPGHGFGEAFDQGVQVVHGRQFNVPSERVVYGAGRTQAVRPGALHDALTEPTVDNLRVVPTSGALTWNTQELPLVGPPSAALTGNTAELPVYRPRP